VAVNVRPRPDDPIAAAPSPASAWNVANGLTVLRLLLVPIFALVLFHGDGHETGWRIGACAIFVAASITDRLDGEVARKRRLVTEFGKLADPIADKALTGTALVLLSLYHALPWWVTIVILVREVGVTLLRLWVARVNVIPASPGGKIKTVLQIVAIAWYIWPFHAPLAAVGPWLMAAALVVTVVTGVDYVVRVLRIRRAAAGR
jgi:CDP-diacylglycerol--glycerol-3-phosphate 3-phosphatidyltransferase